MPPMKKRRKILIMGAAGRDFHNFNTVYRNNRRFKVVAFTAAQIPNIDERRYPMVLAGRLYPQGIEIYPEEELTDLIKKHKIDDVIFSYSDVSHNYVMNKAVEAIAAGAAFKLLSVEKTMLKSSRPVISICAVRTGCGKSQTTSKVCDILKSKGRRVVVVRHPMPYGNLSKQVCQRFETYDDMIKQECTIEEMEEYERHISKGVIVYAGVDYEKILKKAEKEADVIIWDGGNNDTPFFKPDLEIVVADPHRAGHELTYYPGSVNFRRADVLVINKVDSARRKDVKIIVDNARMFNSDALIIKAESAVEVEETDVKPKKVLVIEDGPTLTHGGMGYGAGIVAARTYFKKARIINPKKYAVGSIKEVYKKYKHLDKVLPAMGYGEDQMEELQATINKTDCDLVIVATPTNLKKLLKINKPSVRVSYYLKEKRKGKLEKVLRKF